MVPFSTYTTVEGKFSGGKSEKFDRPHFFRETCLPAAKLKNLTGDGELR